LQALSAAVVPGEKGDSEIESAVCVWTETSECPELGEESGYGLVHYAVAVGSLPRHQKTRGCRNIFTSFTSLLKSKMCVN